MTLPQNLWCCGCDRLIPIKEFYMNHNENHAEHYSRHFYCKAHTKEISQKIMAKYCKKVTSESKLNYELAIREICNIFDMPYINDAMIIIRDLELSSTKPKDWDYVYQYGCALNELGYKDEKYWNNLSGNTLLAVDLFRMSNNNDAKPNSDGDAELLFSLEKKWGKQESINDYFILEEKFNSYASGENLTTAMEVLLRYLCQAELDVMKLKSQKCDQKEISIAEKRVTDYFAKLKLDDFKFDKAKSEEDKLIETFAFNHENLEPLEWEDKEGILKDRLGIDRDYDDAMRSLGNKVVGTKDYPNLTEFIEEEKKYRKKKKK